MSTTRTREPLTFPLNEGIIDTSTNERQQMDDFDDITCEEFYEADGDWEYDDNATGNKASERAGWGEADEGFDDIPF